MTGNNNCGKTSILEILDSFGQPDDFRRWRSLIRKDVRTALRAGVSYYEGFYNLFGINLEEKYLRYVIVEDSDITEVSVFANVVEEEINDKEYMDMAGVVSISEEQETELSDMVHLVSRLDMEAEINGKSVRKLSIYDAQKGLRLPFQKGKKYTRNIIYISPFSHMEGNIFWGQILDNPELYEEILNILKEYDESVISLNYDNDDSIGGGKGVYKILSKSHQKALPLNVYGDGMKKAALLISAVIKAQNGILLLDEFETAIHTSAMDKTVKWILETCKKLNVQVFLTSHSKEAIDKVLKCAPDMLDDITVYTMYKEDDEISVRRLNAKKAVEVQDEMGLELR